MSHNTPASNSTPSNQAPISDDLDISDLVSPEYLASLGGDDSVHSDVSLTTSLEQALNDFTKQYETLASNNISKNGPLDVPANDESVPHATCGSGGIRNTLTKPGSLSSVEAGEVHHRLPNKSRAKPLPEALLGRNRDGYKRPNTNPPVSFIDPRLLLQPESNNTSTSPSSCLSNNDRGSTSINSSAGFGINSDVSPQRLSHGSTIGRPDSCITGTNSAATPAIITNRSEPIKPPPNSDSHSQFIEVNSFTGNTKLFNEPSARDSHPGGPTFIRSAETADQRLRKPLVAPTKSPKPGYNAIKPTSTASLMMNSSIGTKPPNTAGQHRFNSSPKPNVRTTEEPSHINETPKQPFPMPSVMHPPLPGTRNPPSEAAGADGNKRKRVVIGIEDNGEGRSKESPPAKKLRIEQSFSKKMVAHGRTNKEPSPTPKALNPDLVAGPTPASGPVPNAAAPATGQPRPAFPPIALYIPELVRRSVQKMHPLPKIWYTEDIDRLAQLMWDESNKHPAIRAHIVNSVARWQTEKLRVLAMGDIMPSWWHLREQTLWLMVHKRTPFKDRFYEMEIPRLQSLLRR